MSSTSWTMEHDEQGLYPHGFLRRMDKPVHECAMNSSFSDLIIKIKITISRLLTRMSSVGFTENG